MFLSSANCYVAIPSLPRVLDALSTIMWPSMQTSTSTTNKSRATSQRGAAFLEWAQSSFDASEPSLEGEDIDISSASTSRVTPRVQTEMAELSKWLEEGEKEDPWKTSDLSFSPTEFGGDAWGSGPASEVHILDGFDDDFSVFVSAPPVEPPSPSLHPSDDRESSLDDVSFDVSFGSDRLGPEQGDIMYHSLGSYSDLGDTSLSQDVPQDSVDGDSDGDHDEDMPSQAEIKESAQRIFGSQNQPAHSSQGDEDEFDLAPFDLGQVMSALQGMKAEVANMDNEEQRRKAAARIALGLVYGLEQDSKDEA